MIKYNEPFRYATASGFTPGATPEDVFTISGNSITNVYVCAMGISTVQTVDNFEPWAIVKRSTPNIGGISISLQQTPFNSNGPAANATVLQYTTTAVTDGTLQGSVWAGYVMSNDQAPTNDVAGYSGVEIDFEKLYGAPIVLLSANESLGWNFNGNVKPAGLTVIAWVTWYELYKV